MQAADRGFAEVLTMTFPTATQLEDQRQRAYRGFLQLVRRAKKTGQLRPDFTSQDLVILLMANAGVIAATRAAAPGTWERLVGYMLQAFTAPQPATSAATTRPPRTRPRYGRLQRPGQQHPRRVGSGAAPGALAVSPAARGQGVGSLALPLI